MLLDRIEIHGFRRLQKASVYVGRKTVALVGPNEAGKTSVLSALMLFNDSNPVAATSFSRSDRDRVRAEDEDVVRLSFTLTPDQRRSLDEMPLKTRPSYFRRHKTVSAYPLSSANLRRAQTRFSAFDSCVPGVVR